MINIDIWAFNWVAKDGSISPTSFSESFNKQHTYSTKLPNGDYLGEDLMWSMDGIILKTDFKPLDPKQIRNLF